MSHPLEVRYDLTADELLSALDRRFRARVTLEGAVAEVQLERKIRLLLGTTVMRFESHDQDGHPDFSVWVEGRDRPILVECKNVRNSDEAYRSGGEVVAYKVEVQKTRASKNDPTSRFYGVDQFDVLAVCLGKKTGRWTDFAFVLTTNLTRHRTHSKKLAVMHRVPLPGQLTGTQWYDDLGQLLVNSRLNST
jgi:hypothetical protein